MYVLNVTEKKIKKMDNEELSIFLNNCSVNKLKIENFVFTPFQRVAKKFILEQYISEGLNKCHNLK